MTPRDLDSSDPRTERLLELLADRATTLLSESEEAELSELLAEGGVHPDSIDLAAAALAAALVTSESTSPMPDSLRMAIEARASKDIALHRHTALASVNDAGRARALEDVSAARTKSSTPLKIWSGWLAAAACLAIAVVVAFYRPSPVAGNGADPRSLRRIVDAASGTLIREWSPWPAKPEAEGGIAFDSASKVTGRVVWNQTLQKGYMVFSGLPKNPVSARQYQLWILDKKQQHPIDGGVFDVTDEGEVVVPIDAKIAVQEPVGFGITEEPFGGVVVSDQRRRVVVALLQP